MNKATQDTNAFMVICNMYDDIITSMNKQIKQMDEEMNGPGELYDSLVKKDIEGILDGVGDVGFVDLTLRLLDEGPHNVDEYSYDGVLAMVSSLSGLSKETCSLCITEVASSNLSKFDTTPEDAKATVEHYKSKGVEVYTDYNEETELYVTRSSKEQMNGYSKIFEDKILKSIVNFKGPCFDQLKDRADVQKLIKTLQAV